VFERERSSAKYHTSLFSFGLFAKNIYKAKCLKEKGVQPNITFLFSSSISLPKKSYTRLRGQKRKEVGLSLEKKLVFPPL
jgi:hypothetical protein